MSRSPVSRSNSKPAAAIYAEEACDNEADGYQNADSDKADVNLRQRIGGRLLLIAGRGNKLICKLISSESSKILKLRDSENIHILVYTKLIPLRHFTTECIEAFFLDFYASKPLVISNER